MKKEIIPSILCNTAATAKRRIALIESVAETVQIDVMDNSLVPYDSWHDADEAVKWTFDIDYEIHLMVDNPLPIIHAWKRVPRFIRAIIHAEIPKKLSHVIKAIRKLDIQIGIAISPGTPLKKILPHIADIDMVLVMGGIPGRSGQSLNTKTIDTVRELRKRFPKLPIGFDIGVNAKTIHTLSQAGVTRFCSANAIFKSPSLIKAFQSLEHEAIS